MPSWVWTLLAGAAGLLFGLVLGGGAGSLVGGGVGALSGAHLGACRTALVAVDRGIVDEATANRIVTEALSDMRSSAPELVKTGASDLATCRTEKGMDLFAG